MWIKRIMGVSLVAAGVYWLRGAVQQEDIKEEAEQASLQIEEVPPGVLDEWSAFIDKRLRAQIFPSDGLIEIRPLPSFSQPKPDPPSYVSRTIPFSIDCEPYLGISVTFASGGDGDNVEIASFLGLGSPGRPRTASPDTPDLPLPLKSPAVQRLAQALCPRVAAYMAELTKP